MGAKPTEKPAPRKVISLGEIRIWGDVERPSISFLIPRSKLDFLDGRELLSKENLLREIEESVKSDIFEVQ
jgi:hypothetical protein